MAAPTFADNSAPAKYYPTPQHPLEVDPTDVPDVYAKMCRGNCLEPVLADGSCIVFSKTDEPVPGDFVGIWLHPDFVAPDEFPQGVKRLVIGLGGSGFSLPYRPRSGDEVEPIIIFETLNPRKRYMLKASKVIAMHKAIGVAEVDGSGQARLTRQIIGGRVMRCHEES